MHVIGNLGVLLLTEFENTPGAVRASSHASQGTCRQTDTTTVNNINTLYSSVSVEPEQPLSEIFTKPHRVCATKHDSSKAVARKINRKEDA